MWRLWLLLLICLAVPLRLSALPLPTQAPCPMAAVMAAQLASGDLSAEDLSDCCNDAATFAATGEACNPAQDCGAASVALPAPARATAALPFAQAPPQVVTTSWPAGPPASLWRPPASC